MVVFFCLFDLGLVTVNLLVTFAEKREQILEHGFTWTGKMIEMDDFCTV